VRLGLGRSESILGVGRGESVMILHLAIIALSTRKRLERQCPECGRKLVFPPSRINETVLCAKCEAPIPPKGKTRI
jgi:hypothetical protein